MNLNPRELQKFYDLWAPMLQALPAVIEAADREEELKRGVATIERQLQVVQQKIADEEARIDPVRESVAANIQKLKESQAVAQQGYDLYLSDAKAHIEKVDAEVAEKVASINERAKVAANDLRSVERDLVVAKAKADSELKQQKDEIEAEISELAAKKKSIEDALESLKAKIG
jgi:chromosome segregation ATPase